MPVQGRDNKIYRDLSDALRRRGKKLGLPCWICGMPIDYNLDWRHRMSYTYDHIDAIGNGGNMRGEGRPAHRGCNSRRGAQRSTPPPKPVTTRDWYGGTTPHPPVRSASSS